MTPGELIRQFTRDGAALSIYRHHDMVLNFVPGNAVPWLVISSEVVLAPRFLCFHQIGADYTGGVHRLAFDKLTSPHPRRVDFFLDRTLVAFIQPVTEADAEACNQWRQWQAWLAAGNREHHEAAIAAEFDQFVRIAR